jgi:hypothetical protein
VTIPIRDLAHRLAATEVSRRRVVRRVADGNGITTSGSLGKTEDDTDVILTMQRDGTGCQVEGIGREHHVLGDPTGIELVSTCLFHQRERNRSITEGHREVSAPGKPLLLLAVDNDERPVLEILAASGPSSRFEELLDQNIRQRLVNVGTNGAKAEDVVRVIIGCQGVSVPMRKGPG